MPAPSRTIHLLVHDGFADWEAAYALAGFAGPHWQRAPGAWQVRVIAETAAPVRSMGGVAVLPDALAGHVDPAGSALLVIPGGAGWESPDHALAESLARRFVEAGTPVAAICGATAGLARAGLLDDRRHTSNAKRWLAGTGYAGGEHYVEEAAVTDRGVVTAGGMAALEFAREIFRLLAVFEPAVLGEWYALYKTGDSAHFARAQRAADEAADTSAR